MNKVIENADLNWPDGATHWIEGSFVKWADGNQYTYCKCSDSWVESTSNWPLGSYVDTVFDWEIYARPSTPVVDVITQNDALLDAHNTIEKLAAALEFYKNPSIYHRKENAHMTYAQDDCGALAQEAHELAVQALVDIEEHIHVQAGRVAHG